MTVCGGSGFVVNVCGGSVDSQWVYGNRVWWGEGRASSLPPSPLSYSEGDRPFHQWFPSCCWRKKIRLSFYLIQDIVVRNFSLGGEAVPGSLLGLGEAVPGSLLGLGEDVPGSLLGLGEAVPGSLLGLGGGGGVVFAVTVVYFLSSGAWSGGA